MNLFGKILRKNGAFAFQLFSSKVFSLDVFNASHLIRRQSISGLWKFRPVLYQADPFLFVKENELFLFYELQHWDNPAYIVMSKTSDLVNWTKPVIVLREPFHLSFPYVFADNSSIYMIPESQEANEVRLYRANEDLTSFSYVRTLLKQERTKDIMYNYNDSHLYKKGGYYFLFTSILKESNYYQELYYSNNLLKGTFIKHPQSPICVGNEFGRNGGAIIDCNGTMFRVTQNCDMIYGGNVSLMNIIHLDENYYEEVLYKRNLFDRSILFPDGGHQLHVVKFNDKFIYSTDYREMRWTWYYFYVKLLSKMHLR